MPTNTPEMADLAEAERRQRILVEVSRIFLDYTGIDEVEPLRRVVEKIVEGFGDWCAISLVQPDGMLVPVASWHPDPHQRELARRVRESVTPRRWDARRRDGNVLLSAEPVVINELGDRLLEKAFTDPAAFSLVKQMGIRSAIVTALRVGSEPLGSLTLASTRTDGVPFTQRDVDFVVSVGDRASLAVRNARLARALADERNKLAISRDQAEQRAAELVAAFSADPNGVSIYDAEDRLQYLSPNMKALVPILDDSLLGQPFSAVATRLASLVPAGRAGFERRSAALFADRTRRQVDEFAFGTPRRVLRRSSVPVTSPHGAYWGRLFICEDVTAQRELDLQRTEFLTVASHELRTPLTPLSMHLQTIQQRQARGQPIEAELVARARRQVARLSALIDDLLDVSRLDSGRLELHREIVAVDGLVEDVLADFRSAAGRHEFVLQRAAQPISVEGDRPRLEQVLVNLLQNAAKYSPGGGRITVRLEGTETEVSISVSDQGIGIPQEDQKHLFERFFRAQNANARHFAGMGIGLFISHEIVRRHGGRFVVHSVAGEGSSFTVHLPRVKPEVAEAAPPRILIAEDDEAILEAMSAFLRSEGYVVDRAQDGASALEQILRTPPDLILLDLMMPVLDGWSLLETLRRENVAQGVPIIVISADRTSRMRQAELMAAGSLRKPFDLQELQAIVGRFLQKGPAVAAG